MRSILIATLSMFALTGCIPFATHNRILHTTPNVERREVFANSDLRMINAITPVERDGERVIVVGGTDGASFLSEDYSETKFVPFEAPLITAVPVDIEGDGTYEFMSRGGGWSDIKLLDPSGALVWQYPRSEDEASANRAAAGDLDGDGILEFVVATNGGGMYALNADGTTRWWVDEFSHFVEAIDTDGDQESEIIHNGGDLMLRDGDGSILRRVRRDRQWTKYLLWKSPSGDSQLAGLKSKSLILFEQDGNETLQIRLPRTQGDIDDIRPVVSGKTTHYAASVKVPYAYQIGYLYIFDGLGQTIHKEVFPSRVDALATIPDPHRPGNEVLLAASGVQVLEYRIH